MASMGDLLGFLFGSWITSRCVTSRKMVPAYRLPLARRSQGHPVQPGHRPRRVDASAGRPPRRWIRSLSCSTRAATTGLSKGAELTHRNIVAAILQAEAWFTPALKPHRRRAAVQQHRGAAAVSHLRADLVPAGHPLGIAPDAGSQSARHRQVSSRC